MKEFEYKGNNLKYNPDTGEIYRQLPKGKWKQLKAGTVKGGYSQIGINGSVINKHRIIGEVFLGLKPNEDIDHIKYVDGSDYQDRLSNLRVVPRGQNNQNARTRTDNTTGFKGVSFNKRLGKYHSRIAINNKQTHLSYYCTAEEAFIAYLRASKLLHTGYQCLDESQIKRAYKAVPMNDRGMIAAKVDLILADKGLI